MNILAIETSTERASIALQWQGRISQIELASPPAHSATLLPAIRRLLDEQGAQLRELDRLACGVGPGAFTGVRLACAVTQGLALGAGLAVAAVNSLETLAEQSGAQAAYCALDARMSEIYAAAYRRGETGWEVVHAPCCVAPADLPAPPEGDWVCVGTAFAAYPAAAQRVAGWSPGAPRDLYPTAAGVLRLAQTAPLLDPALLAPLYVRDRVALTIAERLAQGGRA
ncbi:MAG: tRNA (adenosine(37)-N6)-threonylcarbamoyltransferase complex dimerization subunit type 1 TsaB [Candidatus Dactylopiibacterium sp.]|nr:tRNA (adenosine(37)-N6)-threonylcarbamoyltransferase complex dimerization subunit type 1 TsaB [Candidatus Dactylopiibacterium sp.]